MTHGEIRAAIREILGEETSAAARLQGVCDLLRTGSLLYDWAGFYLVDRHRPGELVLGPYAGEPTEHVRISFGQGICGQAASTLQVFVVDDVSTESNYLSCSPRVKSEFVAPVIWKGTIAGELDLDSHTMKAFGPEDSELLQWVAEVSAADVAEAAGLAC